MKDIVRIRKFRKIRIWKWIYRLTTLMALLLIGGYWILQSDIFGSIPKGKTLSRVQKSPQYDLKLGQFNNGNRELMAEMNKRTMKLGTFKAWLWGGEERKPKKPLPEICPDTEEFRQNSDEIKVIWLGHSTVLTNFGGKILLFDPVFSKAASPFWFMVQRFQKPVLSLSQLPKIDCIVISHDHYDHLDMKTIQSFAKSPTTFIVPLGVGSHLVHWGISEDRITELDWWQSAIWQELEFIATPAQHFSGRDGFHRNPTLWASWVVKGPSGNLFFSGDSGYGPHFQEIGQRFGPFDLACMENGQYNERWRVVHMMPEETAQAAVDLKAQRVLPIHWGMFEISFHSWYDPALRLAKESANKPYQLLTPKLGELMVIQDPNPTRPWCETFLKKTSALPLRKAP